MIYSSKCGLKTIIFLVGFVVLGILFFGLYPKNFSFGESKVINNSGRMIFNEYSLIHSSNLNLPPQFSSNTQIHLNIHSTNPKTSEEQKFRVLLMLDTDSADGALYLGQWQNILILRTGEDFNASEGSISYSFDNKEIRSAKIRILISSDGAELEVNNEFVGKLSLNQFFVPTSGENSRLYLGNTQYRKNSWEGSIDSFSMSICTTALDGEYTLENRCSSEEKFADFADFFVHDGVYEDQSAYRNDLSMVNSISFNFSQWLSFKNRGSLLSKAFGVDTLLNLLAFVPLGFLLLGATNSKNNLLGICIAVFLGFALSLTIETLQLAIPSRTSSVYDLFFNTLGSGLGAVMHTKLGWAAKSSLRKR